MIIFLKKNYLIMCYLLFMTAPKIVETASRFNGDLPSLFFSIALTIFFATVKKGRNNRERANGNNRYNATKKHKSD